MKRLHFNALCVLSVLLMVLFSVSTSADDDDGNFLPMGHPDLPIFETSADELHASYDETIATANQKLEELKKQDASTLTFENTVQAFEDILDEVNIAYSRASLLTDVHPDEEMRNKGFELTEKYLNWFIDAQSDGEVYQLMKAFSDTLPLLTFEEQKLMDETLLSYQRSGFNEAGEINEAVLILKKEINEIKTQISQMVIEGNKVIHHFTEAELEGLEQKHLDSMEKDAEGYIVRSGSRGILRDIIMTYATSEKTRKRAKAISNSRAKETLAPLTMLISKRLALSKELGYESWADYKTEINMAKDGKTASDFVNTISEKLKPKFKEEVAALSQYLKPDVNDLNGTIDSWDVYYFRRLYEANELQVDYEGIRKYFDYHHVLGAMFDVFEHSFGLYIEPMDVPGTWHQDVQVIRILNALEVDDDDNDDDGDDDGDDENEIEMEELEDAEVLGYLYLDMFPRLDQGKMAHFASYSIIEGKDLPWGMYRKPVNTLVCNFPVDTGGQPQPLLFSDIRTLFHEFGHALHCILSNSRFASQTGFRVPHDFVEVPSQVLEDWTTDENVFKWLAMDHPDVTDAWVKDTVGKIKAANLATVGLMYERQFAFGIMDLLIHSITDPAEIPEPEDPANLIAITNEVMANTYLPFPETSHLITSFNHLLVWGYDAGYYSYAWADSIVAEISSVFENSPKGFLDQPLGLKLRREIFEPGATRDVNISVEQFTGHPIDPERKAFLKRLGVE